MIVHPAHMLNDFCEIFIVLFVLLVCHVRVRAAGVINAGHTVKFTPHFELSSAEIAALADAFDGVCKTYPKTL